MNIKLIKMALLSAFIYVLAGCDGVSFSNFVIEYPENGATYVGHEGNVPKVNGQGASQLGDFKITFKDSPGARPSIALNGHDVSDKFTFPDNVSALASANALSPFLRQGSNSFSVERASFGPAINFTYDGMGPELVVASAEINDANAKLQLKGHLRDFSDLASSMTLKLVQIDGYTSKNAIVRNVRDTLSVVVDEATGSFNQEIDLINVYAQGKPYLYSFEACDAYGYCTETEFIADNEGSEALALQNSVVVALGQTFAQSLKPLLSSTIKTTLDAAPIDARCLKVAGVNPGDANEGEAGPAAGLEVWEDGGMKGRQTDPLFTKKYACADWDDPRICGSKRGVVPGKNITLSEFDAYKAENPTADIADPMFTCNKSADPNTSYFVPSDDPAKDGAKLANLNPFKVSLVGTDYAGYMQHMSFYDGDYANRGLLDGLVNSSTPQGTVTMNQFQILPDNKIHVSLMMTQMFVRLALTQGYNGMCGFWERPFNVQFPAISLFMPKLSIDGDITISKTTGGELVVKMDDNANVSFVEDPKFNELTIGCGLLSLPVGALVDALSGMIKGLIGDMVPGIINQVFADNLKKLRFGGSLIQPDNSTAFNAFLGIQVLGTGSSLQSPNIYDLTTTLDSTVKVTEPDGNAPALLGPVYVADPIDPSEVFNSTSGGDANISVAVSTNMINSMLAALDATGVTYFTSYKGKTYFGANPNTPAENQADKNSPTLSTVKNGDTRVRLWPDVPPIIIFDKTQKKEGQSRAEINFKAATLYQDKFEEGAWVNKIKMQVHFDLAVEINNDGNGNFTIGAAGPPVFIIDDYINKTPIQIPQSALQALVNIAMDFGGDMFADQSLTFDFNQIVASQLNGQTVEYYSSEDNYTLDDGECLVVSDIDQETGEPILSNPDNAPQNADGTPDLICYEFSFDVATYTAGTIGAKNSNLFFQMKLSDSRLPPPYAVPRFDLDGDGYIDYRDNCSVPPGWLNAAVAANGGADQLVYQANDPEVENGSKEAGDAKPNAVTSLRSTIDNWLRNGGGEPDVPLKGSPTQEEIDNYNARRTGDAPVEGSSSNWVDIMYQNPSQASDKDPNGVTGDLCLPDDDYDGIPNYADNCPVTYNPDQLVDGKAPGEAGYNADQVGDACNIRKNFILLKNKSNGKCVSARMSDGTIVPDANTTWREKQWLACDPADPAVRFYLKEDEAETANLDIPNSIVLQLWQKPTRGSDASDNALATIVGTGGEHPEFALANPTLDADDVVLTNSTVYIDAKYHNWIFVQSSEAEAGYTTVDEYNQGYPWKIRSFFFYQKFPSEGWCIFNKFDYEHEPGNRTQHPYVDQDSNSCFYNPSEHQSESDDRRAAFQILVGPEKEPWDGSFPPNN